MMMAIFTHHVNGGLTGGAVICAGLGTGECFDLRERAKLVKVICLVYLNNNSFLTVVQRPSSFVLTAEGSVPSRAATLSVYSSNCCCIWMSRTAE